MVVTTINKKLTTLNRQVGGNTKQFLVIHDVGVKGQTAKNNVDYFAREYVAASAHYFVDRTSIWQSVDDNDCAWHVGDGKGKYGITNSNSIGIEMIVEKDGTIHSETIENTKWLVKQLQAKYKIPNEKIVRHYDASRKNCPQFLNQDGKWTGWYKFYDYLISEGGLTVSQYEELKNLIEEQKKEISNLKNIVSNIFSNEDEASSYAKPALDWAVKEGIFKGNSNGNLMPKAAITRQDLAVTMYRQVHSE